MTDFPKPPEMGHPIDVPPAQPPAPDLSTVPLPGVGESDLAVNEAVALPDRSVPGVPGLAGVSIEGEGEVRQDITRPADSVLAQQDRPEVPEPGPEAADAGVPVEQADEPERAAGAPPDEPPPPGDVPTSSEPGDGDSGEGFSDEELRGLFVESVRDLPPQEYQTTVRALEEFAAGGEQVGRPLHYHEADGTAVDDWDQGYARAVSPDALAAEEVPYDYVGVSALQPNQTMPYTVGMTASRPVVKTIDLPVGDGSEHLSAVVGGEEDVSISFSAEAPDDPTDTTLKMHVYGTLSTLTPVAERSEEGVPETILVPTIDQNAPAMPLDVFRGIMRAIERADEFPEDPASIVLRATTGANDAPNAEMPGPEDAPYRDTPQAARAALLKEADTYARSGHTGPGVAGSTQHVRPIPEDIARQHGFTGTLMARVDEAPGGGYYRAGITTQDVVEVQVPDGMGGTTTRSGAREGYLSAYATTGRLRGYPGQVSRDSEAGDGVHLEYIGHTMYRAPGSHIIDYRVEPDVNYGQVRNMLAALRDANARAREQTT
jgi:hypothetical protein